MRLLKEIAGREIQKQIKKGMGIYEKKRKKSGCCDITGGDDGVRGIRI